MAAPSSPEAPSVFWNQRLAAGDASSTRGFSVELNSTPDITLLAGKRGEIAALVQIRKRGADGVRYWNRH